MQPPLEGIVLVTGASSGIGREMARRIATSARMLILVARREDRLVELRDELKMAHRGLDVRVFPCDLADLGATAAMLDAVRDQAGSVDVLVNNAGFGDRAFFEATQWSKLEEMIAVNIRSLTYLTRRLLPPMIERGAGGILNVSSTLGITYVPGIAAYGATKHYVTAFTHALRAETADTGVVVTQVCPGPVATEFEEIADNRTALSVPGFLQIDAAQCVEESLRAFRRGRAVVYPGLVNRVMVLASLLTPALVYRWIAALMARDLRRKVPPARPEEVEA